jgi:hypothetical protein
MEKNRLLDNKWKTRGYVTSLGIQNETKFINLNDIIGNAKYDTIGFKTLKELFTINNNTPKEYDNFFIVPYKKLINDEYACCESDTLFFNTELIKNKKYLFLSYKNKGSVSIMESSKVDGEEMKREEINIPSWGIRVGSFINDSLLVNKLDDTIAIDGSRYRTQFLKSNNEVFVSTLKFGNSNKSLVFFIEKEISSKELEELLNYIKEKYPKFRIKDYSESLFEGDKKRRTVEVSYRGFYLNIRENSSRSDKYTLYITDDYLFVKSLLENDSRKDFKVLRERELVVKGDPNFWKN